MAGGSESRELNQLVMEEREGSLTFSVRVVPQAKGDGIAGMERGALKVRITAPPVGGKANEALIRFLAELLGLKKRQVKIVRGEKARIKGVKITGLSGKDLRERLGNHIAL